MDLNRRRRRWMFALGLLLSAFSFDAGAGRGGSNPGEWQMRKLHEQRVIREEMEKGGDRVPAGRPERKDAKDRSCRDDDGPPIDAESLWRS